MDVNGSRYHLLFGSRDFQPLLDGAGVPELWFDGARDSLGLRPELFRFPARAGQAPLVPGDRRGADRDRYGTWYWIGADQREVRCRPAGSPRAASFWRVGDLWASCAAPAATGDFAPLVEPTPALAPLLRGLAVTDDHYLVLGTLEPAGLLVFDLHAGGPPAGWLRFPPALDFAPLDLVAAPGGGLWVLDDKAARLWRLDRYFRLVGEGPAEASPPPAFVDEVPSPFEPGAGKAPVDGPAPISEELALVTGVGGARAVEALPDGSVLLLATPAATGYSVVYRFLHGRAAGTVALEGALAGLLAEGSEGAGDDLEGHDFAFVAAVAGVLPGTVAGELTVAATDGDQSFAFELRADGGDFSLEATARLLPMRRYGGKALVAAGGEVHYDLDERWLPLAEQPRPRYARSAQLAGLVFDGRTPGCVWHRLLIDGCLPDGTAIGVESRTAEERDELDDAPWSSEPALYRRADGCELPFHRPFDEAELARDGVGTWELLLQQARGRFVELRLTFAGRGHRTPRVSALRLYYPRFSYSERYLPAVYREEPVSASFVERFLANPEGLFTALEGRIADAQVIFDPRTSPGEYLAWLAGWLGATLDASWEEGRRRLLIAHAEQLFRWRGTPGGLLAMIRLAIDACPEESLFDLLGQSLWRPAAGFDGYTPRIVEHFLLRSAPGVALGDPSALERPGLALTSQPAVAGGCGPDAPVPIAPWQPAQGAGPLHERFRVFLQVAYGGADAVALAHLNQAWQASYGSFAEIRLSPVEPAGAVRAADWRAFLATGLGFTYEPVRDEDLGAYQEFLARRYHRVEALNQAHGLTGALAWPSFGAVELPAEDAFPDSGQRLVDWIELVSLYLPIRRQAHRMTVLVPVAPGEDGRVVARRLAQVEGVVERERPAHVAFEVKPFWALFQVGGARLGIDTVLGEGSRFVALALGTSTLGESFLAAAHPFDVPDRTVVGRDALGGDALQ